MTLLANAAVALVAVLHLYFLVLEMFLWTRPAGRRIFGLSAQAAQDTAALAANQGLYNGFLAAGLVWGLMSNGPFAFSIKVFFLVCILIAGIYGGITTKRSILWFQALPAGVALALVYLAR